MCGRERRRLRIGELKKHFRGSFSPKVGIEIEGGKTKMFRESEVFSSSLVSRGKIRVLVLPVGKIPSETFDHYFKILCKFSCIPLQLLVPPKLTEDTKDSVFQYQSWSYGAVYFEFVNGYKAKGLASAKNDSLPLLTDLHLYKSTLAVFGICHCPSTGDLAKTFGNFLIEADRKAPKSILRHCFAFDVTDTQLAEPGKFSGLEDFTIFVADRNSSDGAGSILEMQMQVDLGDICTRLIHSLSKMVEDGLNGKSSPTLRNGMDAQLAKEDAIMRNKQKKKWELRHQARLRKWAGDFCLLAAAPTDALQHYTMALSMMKQNGKPVDHLWYASAHEGHAAATVMATIEALDTFSSVVAVAVGAVDIMNKSKLPFQVDVKKNCLEACQHFRMNGAVELELSAILKLCRYYTRLQIPKAFDAMKLINEDAHKALHKLRTSGKVCFLVEVCLLCERLGMRRKFAYYSHKLSILYATLMNWNTAQSFAHLSGQAYNIPGCSKQPNRSGQFEDIGARTDNSVGGSLNHTNLSVETHKGNVAALDSETIDTWPRISRQHLLELFQLAKLTDNHDLATVFAVETLRALQNCTTKSLTNRIPNGDGSSPQLVHPENRLSRAESAKTPPKEARIKKILKAKLEVEDLFGLSGSSRRGRNKNVKQSPSSPSSQTRPKSPGNQSPSRSVTGNGTDISSWALPNSIYDAQRAIAKNLSVITGGLMPDVNVNMSNIPKLVSIEALPLKSSLRHYRNEDEQDANKMGAHGTKIYYDPFAKIEKKAKQIEWIEQEIAEVKVTLENSLLIPVHVQHIAMVSPGNGQNIEAYGQSVYIPAKTTQSVILTLKPLSKGRLVLDRVSVTMFNLRWVHTVASSVDTSVRKELATREALSCYTVDVLPKLPMLMVRDVRSQTHQRSRISGSNVTSLSLLDGQVHKHNLLIQNTGSVPVAYIKLQLTLKRRKLTSYDENLSIKTSQTELMPNQSKQIMVFSSADPGSFQEYLDKCGNDEVFSFDQNLFTSLQEKLPLKPGDKTYLPVTIDAQRDTPLAELSLEYGQEEKADVYRKINMPFKMVTTRSVEIVSINIVPFEDGVAAFRRDGYDICESFDFVVVLLINNPTKRSFEITCFGNQGNSKDSASLVSGEEDLAPTAGGGGQPIQQRSQSSPLDSGDKFQTPLLVRSSSLHVPSPGKSDDMTYRLFATSLEAGEAQRISVPVKKMKNPLHFVHDTANVRTVKALRNSCLAYLEKNIRLMWKSSSGTIGSLSLRPVCNSMPPSLCMRMVRSSLSMSWEIQGGNGGNEKLSPGPNFVTGKEGDTLRNNNLGNFVNRTYPSPIKLSSSLATVYGDKGGDSAQGEPWSTPVGSPVRLDVSIKNLEHFRISASCKLRVYKADHKVSRAKLLNDSLVESYMLCSGSVKSCPHTFESFGSSITRNFEVIFLKPGRFKLCLECDGDRGKWLSVLSRVIYISG